jgi:uncharacterized protein
MVKMRGPGPRLSAGARPASRPFHVMAKPIGPSCNLRCEYCFYLEKEALFAPRTSRRMTDATLERFVRQYIEGQPGDRVVFAWQGGEPTLLGIGFYRRAIELQQRYAGGRVIENTLQTNGTLLDNDWGMFLKEHGFLVGVSIDGPAQLHDRYRVDAHGNGSLAAARRGLEVLRRHAVPFNTLTCVNAANGDRPLEVYAFLKQIGSRHLQFIPVVERGPDGHPTAASVGGAQWGRFLISIFDEWIRADVADIYVDMFELSLAKWLGIPGGVCVHNETCGDALALEHDGSVYSCDHYVYPEFRLGTVHGRTLADMVDAPRQVRFGLDKSASPPAACATCPVVFACHGGCPKHRFTAPGEDVVRNRLCAGYLAYFGHVDRPMRVMADLYRRGHSPAEIMRMP